MKQLQAVTMALVQVSDFNFESLSPIVCYQFVNCMVCVTAVVTANAVLETTKRTSHVAQSCYSVIGDKPFLWSKPKFDPP